MKVKDIIKTLEDIETILNACSEGYVDHGDTIKDIMMQYRDVLLEMEVKE